MLIMSDTSDHNKENDNDDEDGEDRGNEDHDIVALTGRLVVEKPADSFTCLPYPARYFNLNFPSKLFLEKVFWLSPTKTFPEHIFWQSGCIDG